MTVHRYHPIPPQDREKAILWGHVPPTFGGDPPDAVLYDFCDRCAEHATHPNSLDQSHLALLAEMALGHTLPKTANERLAIRNLT